MRITSIIILLLLVFAGYSQRPLIFNNSLIEDPQITFDRITSEDGLSHNRVTDILQDIHGFVWIATTNGLNRYDGELFESYTHNEDNYTSISSSFVTCIDQDSKGNLYIGTKKGLATYDRVNNNFITIPIDKMNLTPSIRQIMMDNDTILWIETSDGYLLKFDVLADSLLKSYKHNPVSQKYYLYHDIYRDKEGTLWIGMRNRDPMYLDEEQDVLVSIEYDIDDYSKKRASDMACFYEDSYGNFWFTALDGVYLFDKKTTSFRKFMGTTTYDVKEDDFGNIWFATGSGVMRWDPLKDEMLLMDNEKDNLKSISSNNVYCIMEDNQGNLWFGTSNGVNIYSRPAYPFDHFTHIPGITNSPEGYVTTAVAEDDKNNLWIGYEKDGLDYFDRESLTFTHYLSDPDVNSIGSNKVSTLYFDQEGTLWIGLWRGIGFNLFDIEKEEFTLYSYDPNSFEKDWYSDFVMDATGNYYIGFWGADGLTGFDKRAGVFTKSYKRKFERETCSRLITDLLLDRKESIWMATTDCGLHRFFPEKDSAVSFFSDGEIDRGLLSNETSQITEDNSGNIWVINDVLQKYIPERDSFITYGYESGLTSVDLKSVIADNNGDIWIGTGTDGLFRFNPQSRLFNQYVKDDGLESNSFTEASLKLKSGELFLGCNNGFVLFNPDEIKETLTIPVPYFGRLYVYDHIYSHDLNEESTIELESDANVFTVELRSSDLVNPERYSYACKLLGYDRDWVEIDNKQRKVRYAAVPPGNYTLKYRIGNRKGEWSDKTCEIRFRVEKPYYLTWWFISILLVILVIIIVLVIKQREFDLKQKHRNVELQQRLFRLQMNPHFMYNSLLAIQNYIFSHNPAEAGNYLSDFARLFRLILNNSRSEFIKISKEIETLNLYLKLQALRYPDKFSYNIEVDPDIDIDLIMIPPMLAQPMIENALEHGLFYKVGHGHIKISFMYKKDKLFFEVVDNGIGFTKAKEKKDKHLEHQSTALEITRERIKILGKRHGFFAIFEITELKNDNGEVQGTSVKFNLPTKLSLFEERD